MRSGEKNYGVKKKKIRVFLYDFERQNTIGKAMNSAPDMEGSDVTRKDDGI